MTKRGKPSFTELKVGTFCPGHLHHSGCRNLHHRDNGRAARGDFLREDLPE